MLSDDGTFTWSVGGLAGTWQATGSQLTLSFRADSSFCAGGNLVWDYEVTDATLTADVVGGECDGTPAEQPPESPDWTFERQ